MNYRQTLSGIKLLSRISATISLIIPLIVIPYLAYRFNNWWLLFGSLISFVGAIVTIAKWGYSFLALATLFAIGFWFKSGFDIHQYVTFYYFSLLAGFWSYKTLTEYNQRYRLLDQQLYDATMKEYKELTEGETGLRIKAELEEEMKKLKDKNSN